MKCFKFEKQLPGAVQYRYGHNGPYQTLNICDRPASRSSKLPTKLVSLCKAQLPISRVKYMDLMKLCRKKGIIPTEVQQWYVDLPHSGNVHDVTNEPAVEDTEDEEVD